MDELPPSGEGLSETDRDLAGAERSLRDLAESSPLRVIRAALGEEAALHIVGGTIRDLLAGQEPAEVDLACALPAQESARRLTAHALKVVPTGIEHGTLTIVWERQVFELTTFRKPSARGRSLFSGAIEEDLSGRDFTINALAYAVDHGPLLDPYHGLEDLRQKRLRAVGIPADRFREDPLRILRMLRFGPAQGRTLEEDLAQAARLEGARLAGVSIERIRSELEKIVTAQAPQAALLMARTLGLLQYTLPEMLPTVGFEQNEFHIHDVFEHSLAVLQNCAPDLVLRLTALFHDVGKVETVSADAEGRRHFYEHEAASASICSGAMTRLRFSTDQIRAVSAIVALHMRPLDCGPAGLRRLMKELGPWFDHWLAFKIADAPPKMDPHEFGAQLERFRELVAAEKERLKGSVYGKLALNGDDLIALGMQPGVLLGRILKQIESMVIENPDLNDKPVLLELAKDIIGKHRHSPQG
jgi:tRNA nucleotidyltransferase (CCA-adding enzyme)